PGWRPGGLPPALALPRRVSARRRARPARPRPGGHRPRGRTMTVPPGLAAAAIGATGLTVLAAVDAVPEISFVWQVVTIATFIGGVVAYVRKQRDPDYDHFSLIVRWSVAGLVVGPVIALIDGSR